MSNATRAIIGVLVVVVIGLAVALGFAFAMDDDDDDDHMGNGTGFAGMMGAMGAMDSGAMLSHMRGVLGEDGFKKMQEHLRSHQAGGSMTGMPEIDQMMHRMMDGMMGAMPKDQSGLLPVPSPTSDPHAGPGPTMTPTGR